MGNIMLDKQRSLPWPRCFSIFLAAGIDFGIFRAVLSSIPRATRGLTMRLTFRFVSGRMLKSLDVAGSHPVKRGWKHGDDSAG
jgi:hypothetical protein